ncbi:Inactive dipeptidyl peptidase 10 [Acipenser ruthenus]|uniref:Inactive dipeptidyl peptidase 10 n=1 Tax=Acipenser ruthenus TaxID=7906 RepID=A0A444UFN3_ACIRT|nr:Inactive dipeptidyl peptidase 10 [Acipenser ruthenus]
MSVILLTPVTIFCMCCKQAGQTNPTVKLFVTNLYGQTHTQELTPPTSFKARDHYVSMVKWISNTKTAVRWLNRPQNVSILTVCDTTTGACSKKHEVMSEIWLSKQTEEPVFSKDSNKFFLSVPVKQGGRGEFHHIAMFTTQSTNEQISVRHLTSGDWEVTRILAYDEIHQKIVSAVGLFPRHCLSCELNKPKCTYFSADISPSNQHFILHCKGPGIPVVTLHSMNNPKKLPLKLSYPVNFSESQRYGLLFLVDGAPGSQLVTDRFLLDWDSVLVSSHDVIVARFDGRGSGFQGERVLQAVHQQLGIVDVQDQIAAIEYLKKLPYIDPDRIGIFGKGYGGYITLMMLKSTDELKCAVAMAPVTEWKLYDFQRASQCAGLERKECDVNTRNSRRWVESLRFQKNNPTVEYNALPTSATTADMQKLDIMAHIYFAQ